MKKPPASRQFRVVETGIYYGKLRAFSHDDARKRVKPPRPPQDMCRTLKGRNSSRPSFRSPEEKLMRESAALSVANARSLWRNCFVRRVRPPPSASNGRPSRPSMRASVVLGANLDCTGSLREAGNDCLRLENAIGKSRIPEVLILLVS